MGVLQGKVAIVTGAGQGIGRGIALAFAKEEASVAVVDIDPKTATDTAKEIMKLGKKGMALTCDVGDREQVQRMVDLAVNEFGPVDILVNNAQAMGHYNPVERITDSDVHVTLQSGLMGTLYCSQACFPYMKERGGKIINFGSIAGIIGVADNGIYSATKEAIRGLSRSMATDWAKYKINVNVICPGAATAFALRWFQSVDSEVSKMFRAQKRLAMVGDCERDIGRAAVFLAGPDSDYITAQSLMVDGGFTTT